MSHQKSNEPEVCEPKCLPIFEKGFGSGQDFCLGMTALMSDLAAQRLNAGIGNAICNAGGKILKMVEMNNKHGAIDKSTGLKNLQLIQ